jgi:membrane protease YdiL (CAAX protease family)
MAMRNEARGKVWKVWLYAVASVVLGAWISPLLYNAGKALAEVSACKTTNGFLERLAGLCRVADFPRFYEAGLWLAAAVLLVPWLEWMRAKGGGVETDGVKKAISGQPLRRNSRGWWHGCAGFLLVAGLLLLALGLALEPAGWVMLRHHGDGLAPLVLAALTWTLALAVVMEVFFRGLVLGVFLRAISPAAALGMSAAFFALVLSVIPPPGLNVADPEAAGTGFEMLRLLAWRFADGHSICGKFLPLLALGGVLAYARWRTASLWLPIGLHTGWLLAQAMRCLFTAASGVPGTHGPVLADTLLQQGFIPLGAILVAGVLVHYLTVNHDAVQPAHP